jgi:uncharacterized membrane protein
MHGSPCHDPLLKSKFCFSGMSSARNQGFSCVLSRAIYFQVPWIFQVQTKQFSISSWRSTVATQSIITLIEIPNIFTIQLINFFIYIKAPHKSKRTKKKKNTNIHLLLFFHVSISSSSSILDRTSTAKT